MSILMETVYRNECRGTHHKLAVDGLRLLEGKNAEGWRRLFLRYYEDYLDGAKAPDTQIKDFKNHVLHIGEQLWGGAAKTAVKWYERTVDALSKQDWSEAVFCAGVLTHYYSDPLQPLHTAQSEDEAPMHRALEWSVSRCYDQLIARLPSLGGWPQVKVPTGQDWLSEMVREGAATAHPHYRTLIDRYQLEAGVRNPPAGLTDDLRDLLARLLGHAAVGIARILERAFEESQATPPGVAIGALGMLTRLTSPFAWVGKAWSNRGEQRVVRKIAAEYRRTGAVIKSLPADDREVRRLHAEEVLKTTIEQLNERTLAAAAERRQQQAAAKPAKPTKPAKQAKPMKEPTATKAAAPADDAGPPTVRITNESAKDASQDVGASQPIKRPDSRPEQPAATRVDRAHPANGDRFHLARSSTVEEAPSIGPKTAKRLARIGVQTVDDLLSLDPAQAASQLDSDYIQERTIRDWQAQAMLVCRIPHLRGHDAQMLVGCGMTDPQLIAGMKAEELLDKVENFLISEEGERILRVAREPDQAEVERWIEYSARARKLSAAA